MYDTQQTKMTQIGSADRTRLCGSPNGPAYPTLACCRGDHERRTPLDMSPRVQRAQPGGLNPADDHDDEVLTPQRIRDVTRGKLLGDGQEETGSIRTAAGPVAAWSQGGAPSTTPCVLSSRLAANNEPAGGTHGAVA